MVHEQLLSWWRQSRNASSVLMVAAVLCLAIAIVWIASDGSVAREPLLGGYRFETNELANAEAVWAKQGCTNYTIQDAKVLVPSGEQPRYLAALADAGTMPHDLGQDLLDLSTKFSPFLSQSARAESLHIAKQNMLAQIIRRMQGIENAWVVIDRTMEGGLKREVLLSASVSVQANQPLVPERVQQIQQLVSGAIAGMQANEVAVVDLNSTEPTMIENDASDPDTAMLRRYENQNLKILRQRLAHIADCQINVQADIPQSNAPEHPIQTKEETDRVWMNEGQLSVTEKLSSTHAANPVLTVVAVGVPERHLEQLWTRYTTDNVPQKQSRQEFETQEIKKIEEGIVRVLPTSSSTKIQVYTLPTKQADLLASEDQYLSIHSQLVVAGILLVGGLVLIYRTWWKPCVVEEQSRNAVSTLHDQLKQKVQQDPTSAAATLQKWLHPAHPSTTNR